MEDAGRNFTRTLKLSDREAKGLKIIDVAAASASRRKHTIVCRVLRDKPVHAETFIEVFTRLWQGLCDVHITEAEGDRFLAVFGCGRDMKKVLEKEPWEFDNSLVVMAPLNSARSCSDVPLLSTPFWIQAWNVPPDYQTPEVASDIGNMLGEFIDAKKNDKGFCIGKFLCMQVRMPIDTPLMRQTNVDFLEYPDETIMFRYERLPSFCQECGMLDHFTGSCSSKLGVVDVPEKDRNFQLFLRAETDVFGRKIITTFALSNGQNEQNGSPSMNWWPESKSGGGEPAEGVSPPPREVERPQTHKSTMSPQEEKWVTIYGFSEADTNLVLREFEKCGVILKHVPGPKNAKWMHILYQSSSDAQKALGKNGMQINGALIIGVKPVDPMQSHTLNETTMNNQRFMTLPTPSSTRYAEVDAASAAPRSYYRQNGNTSARQSGGPMAHPTKSFVSEVINLMFRA